MQIHGGARPDSNAGRLAAPLARAGACARARPARCAWACPARPRAATYFDPNHPLNRHFLKSGPQKVQKLPRGDRAEGKKSTFFEVLGTFLTEDDQGGSWRQGAMSPPNHRITIRKIVVGSFIVLSGPARPWRGQVEAMPIHGGARGPRASGASMDLHFYCRSLNSGRDPTRSSEEEEPC